MVALDLQSPTVFYALQALLTGLLWFAIIDFIMGLGLIVSPKHVFRANEELKKWITFRRQSRYLNKVFRIEPFIYRFPRTFGIIFFLYALYALYWLMFRFDLQAMVGTYSIYFNSGAVEYVARSLYIIFTGFSLIGIVVGITLLLNPVRMQSVDDKLNTWVSVRHVLKNVETMHEAPDQFIGRHPRLVGSLVCIACLYFFGSLVYFNWFIYIKF